MIGLQRDFVREWGRGKRKRLQWMKWRRKRKRKTRKLCRPAWRRRGRGEGGGGGEDDDEKEVWERRDHLGVPDLGRRKGVWREWIK